MHLHQQLNKFTSYEVDNLKSIVILAVPGSCMPNVFLPSCNSYYGLIVWFPDMIRYLQDEAYESRVKIFDEEEVSHFTFNFTLENQIHRNGEYRNDK